MNVPITGLALAALADASALGGAAAAGDAGDPRAEPRRRLVIRNAMVIYGNAKPPYGPVDIVVQDGLIAYIGPADATPARRWRCRRRRDRPTR